MDCGALFRYRRRRVSVVVDDYDEQAGGGKTQHIHRRQKCVGRGKRVLKVVSKSLFRVEFFQTPREITTADNGNEELDQMKTENHNSGDSLTPTSADDDAKMKSESNSTSDRGGVEGINESQTALASTDGTIVFRTLKMGNTCVCL